MSESALASWRVDLSVQRSGEYGVSPGVGLHQVVQVGEQVGIEVDDLGPPPSLAPHPVGGPGTGVSLIVVPLTQDADHRQQLDGVAVDILPPIFEICLQSSAHHQERLSDCATSVPHGTAEIGSTIEKENE